MKTSMDDFPFPAQLEILPAWEKAARYFLERGGVVMVLGAPDTGKSTLCRYLVYRAYAAGERVALIDLDVGQSHLGPPTTLGLGLYPPRRPGDDGLSPEGLYFIGQTSPVGAILEVTVGCRVLADLALARRVRRVVVNTSGFVQGPGALRLKRSQAELLNPALILGLQRERELEPLLRGLGGTGARGEETSPRNDGSVWMGSPHPDQATHPQMEGSLGPGEFNSANPLNPTPALPPQAGGSMMAPASPGGKSKVLPESQPEDSNGPSTHSRNPNGPFPPAGEKDRIISGWPLIRLPVSSRVSRRTPEERRHYREGRFRRYFRRARPQALPWRSLVWEGVPRGQGEPLRPGELAQLSRILGVTALYGEAQGRRVMLLLAQAPPERPGTSLAAWEQVHWHTWPSLHLRLVGLLDGRRRTLGLGLIRPGPWDPEVLALWTPLAPGAMARVRFVKVGKLQVSLKGQELSDV